MGDHWAGPTGSAITITAAGILKLVQGSLDKQQLQTIGHQVKPKSERCKPWNFVHVSSDCTGDEYNYTADGGEGQKSIFEARRIGAEDRRGQMP
jgi:hypothetical protein